MFDFKLIYLIYKRQVMLKLKLKAHF